MNAILKPESQSNTLDQLVIDAVTTMLSERIADRSSPMGGMDRWTQQRIVAEITEKASRVLESSDPVEHCYQNLIREIDLEAETGVLLANRVLGSDSLKLMCDDPGVSGELYRDMERIAPVMFADEYERSNADLDLVWAAVQAQYDRARLESESSELIMQFLIDSAEHTHDMSSALRSMFFSFHEDGIRRQFSLPSLLDERETRDLLIMVSGLVDRAAKHDRPSKPAINRW
ncbi:MAG: hypothetical protein M8840_14110 [marine benthic group bacterium]|jgi:hypothetical protein|nr:hypothetical protein [Gemmatimonadota bacterium]